MIVEDVEAKVEYNDITQIVKWKPEDWDTVNKHFIWTREAKERKDKKILKQLIDAVDYTIEHAKAGESTHSAQPLEVVEKKDRIVAAGRSRAAELITGESKATFDNMAIGLSQIPAQDSDFKLYEEVGRVSSQLTGFVGAAGSVIKHVATFSPSFPSNTYWEVAPVDTDVESDDQAIFARVVFSADRPAIHVAGEDFFTVHHSTFTSSGA
ncbi:MAG TPA: hypothetical protein VEV83_15475 [Parafilimonas sp.]|nr:hypothetical protein [Parafilimonas sp.]